MENTVDLADQVEKQKIVKSQQIIETDEYKKFIVWSKDEISKLEEELYDEHSNIDEIKYSMKQVFVARRTFGLFILGEYVKLFWTNNSISEYIKWDIGIFEQEIRCIDPEMNKVLYNDRDVISYKISNLSKFSSMREILFRNYDPVDIFSPMEHMGEFVPKGIL